MYIVYSNSRLYSDGWWYRVYVVCGLRNVSLIVRFVGLLDSGVVDYNIIMIFIFVYFFEGQLFFFGGKDFNRLVYLINF